MKQPPSPVSSPLEDRVEAQRRRTGRGGAQSRFLVFGRPSGQSRRLIIPKGGMRFSPSPGGEGRDEGER